MARALGDVEVPPAPGAGSSPSILTACRLNRHSAPARTIATLSAEMTARPCVAGTNPSTAEVIKMWLGLVIIQRRRRRQKLQRSQTREGSHALESFSFDEAGGERRSAGFLSDAYRVYVTTDRTAQRAPDRRIDFSILPSSGSFSFLFLNSRRMVNEKSQSVQSGSGAYVPKFGHFRP